MKTKWISAYIIISVIINIIEFFILIDYFNARVAKHWGTFFAIIIFLIGLIPTLALFEISSNFALIDSRIKNAKNEMVNRDKRSQDRGYLEELYVRGCKLLEGDELSQIDGFNKIKVAAKSGNAMAMYKLGECYEFGIGVEQSYPDAKEWFQKALDNGIVDASVELSNIEKFMDS